MKSRIGSALAVSVALLVLTAAPALAGTAWICSVNEAVACDEDGTIGPPDLGGLTSPTFLRVDADAKQITLLAPEARQGEITKIGTVQEGEGVWVFSGVEDLRAWSLVISDDGHLTLSVTMDGATWSVFGNAMREE